MAKKKVPQEICIFCGEKPCVCNDAGPPPPPAPEDALALMKEVRERTKDDPPDLADALEELRDQDA